MLENKIQYKLIIAYDGTDFDGWQVQPNQRSVANSIENRFYDVFKKKIHLTAASRTDAGVHAYGQVAAFTTDLTLDFEKMRWALQRSLPASITIRCLEPIFFEFNPRYDVIQKVYWYQFFLKQPLPWLQRFGYYQSQPVDLTLLEKALQIFVGTHDFRSFCSGTDAKTTLRTIDSIDVQYDEQWASYRIVFKGRSFLRYMIRRIVGASLYVAQKNLDLSFLHKALEEKNPCQLFPTAPAQGLMLQEVSYKT